jgi:tetratricopeptide (TPR) repeat protein
MLAKQLLGRSRALPMSRLTYPLEKQPSMANQPGSKLNRMTPTGIQDLQVMLENALRHYEAGRLAEAEQLCLQILAHDARHADGLYLLGMTGYRTGRYEMATKIIRRAIAVNPRQAFYHSNLGNALKALGKLDEAVDCFERALALRPDFAEASFNLGNTLHAQGKRGEAVASYRRALALKPAYAEALCNLGNTLQAQGGLDEAISSYERALAIDPGYADARCNLGNILRTQKKFGEAVACFEQVLALEPDHLMALCSLGNALFDQGKLDEAVACFERARALQPDCAEAYNGLGSVLESQDKFDEAVTCFERALAIKPDYAEACANLGAVLVVEGKPEEALRRFTRALEFQPDYARARMNSAMLQLLAGDFASGWRNFESRWSVFAPRGFSQPLWRGEPLAGARILLHAEQGLGDSLQFLRYLPLVQEAGGAVVLELPARLRRLAAQLPGIAALVNSGDPLPPFDCHCPLMSLPLALSAAQETIPAQVPYLRVPEEALQAAAALAWPAAGLRVGLVWAGSPNHAKNRFRSMPLALLEPLFGLRDIHFFSLQMGPETEQLGAQPSALGAHIADLSQAMGSVSDMADTAALIAQLDLVISVDTSVAHLAGALAKPVWVLLSYAADWRWLLDREDSPWYPTARLFRQPALGDWTSVVENVRTALLDMALVKME